LEQKLKGKKVGCGEKFSSSRRRRREGGRGVGGEGRGEVQEKEEENGWRIFLMCGL
jgi:hypothetical protein